MINLISQYKLNDFINLKFVFYLYLNDNNPYRLYITVIDNSVSSGYKYI